MSLAALRERLALIDPPPRAGRGAIPTGIVALDRLLSDGGVPSGRLTEVVGARGSGKTTLVRQLVAGALATKRWVAYVDGTRALAPRDWVTLSASGRLWVIRPASADRGAWCADVLLRSGAFGMVVLDGAPALSRQVAIRLTRLARERDAALVVVSDEGAGAIVGTAVRLRVNRGARNAERGQDNERRFIKSDLTRVLTAGRRDWLGAFGKDGQGGPSPVTRHPSREATSHSRGVAEGAERSSRVSRGAAEGAESSRARNGTDSSPVTRHPSRNESRVRITIDKGGQHQSVEVCCAIEMARRLCAHPEVPDRRGVAVKRGAKGEGRGTRNTESAGRREEGGGRRSEPGHESRIGVEPRVLRRKRRCAEPLVRHDAFLLPER